MIGVIDSGVGGINVLSLLAKKLKHEYIYFCDNKNCPYGNKSVKKLLKITKNNINYLIENYDIEGIIIACNTLSFTIGKQLQKMYKIPIFLMEIDENIDKNALFFATKNTIKNNNFKNNLYIKNLPKKIDNNLDNLDNLIPILKKHFLKYKNDEKIILGCTHFKCIKSRIKQILPNATFIEYEDVMIENVVKNFKQGEKNSFVIVLSKPSYPKFIQIKCFLLKQIKEK